MTESCAACRFWNPIDGNVGECRADLPIAENHQTDIVVPSGPKRVVLGFWPVTGSGQWCGKYEAKPQPAPGAGGPQAGGGA